MLTADQLKAKMLARIFFRGSARAYTARIAVPRQHPAVAGYGIGSRMADDDPGSVEDVVVVYVREKTSELNSIPSRIGGIPTEIIEVGNVRPLAMSGDEPTQRHRPAPGGVSIGHPDVTVGTLGCLVEKNGDCFILSNNHVLANTNRAKPGDKIIQAAAADGGVSPQDDIATLVDFNPLVFDRSNTMDAAIAKVDRREEVSPTILKIGRLRSTICEPEIGRHVCKYGRTTRYTEGFITAIHSDIAVAYRIDGQEYAVWFDDQIIIENTHGGHFSRPGDSGSLIVSKDTSEAIGLLFASSDTNHKITLANPIDTVLAHFNVRIAL